MLRRPSLSEALEKPASAPCTAAVSSALVSRVVALPPATPVRTSSERLSSAIHRRISPATVRGGFTMSRKSPTAHTGWPVTSSISKRRATAGAIDKVVAASAHAPAPLTLRAELAATRSASALRAMRLSRVVADNSARCRAPTAMASLALLKSRKAPHISNPPIGSMNSDNASSSLAAVPSRSKLAAAVTVIPVRRRART